MGYMPENTLVSFEEAVRRGADLVEMDVQLSADHAVVVMHDTSVERTTDGSGFVRDLPWKKIKTMDAGAWFGPQHAEEFVPSLEMVIGKFRQRKTAKGSPLGLIVELKTVRGSGGSLADTVVALLQREEFIERVLHHFVLTPSRCRKSTRRTATCRSALHIRKARTRRGSSRRRASARERYARARPA